MVLQRNNPLSTQLSRVLIIKVARIAFKGLLACGLAAPAFGAELPRTVARALRALDIPLSAVGVVVQEVGASRPELALNAKAPMNPASVMKLVTTYAALE